MKNINELLSPLQVTKNLQYGLIIQCTSYEQCDYIEDVLIEYFEIECYSNILNDNIGEYSLCFHDRLENKLYRAVTQINNYHAKSSKLYETI